MSCMCRLDCANFLTESTGLPHVLATMSFNESKVSCKLEAALLCEKHEGDYESSKTLQVYHRRKRMNRSIRPKQ